MKDNMEKHEDKILRIFDEFEGENAGNVKQASGAEVRPISELRTTKAKNGTAEYYRSMRKDTKNYYKSLRRQVKKQEAEQKRFTRAREKHIKQISKQISKSVKKTLKKKDNISYLRLTPPKGKRNIITRIRHRSHYDNGYYDYIEENIQNGYITSETIANGEVTKKEWKELQAYEDAREDVTVKKHWGRFKALLATVALTGSLVTCKILYDTINDTFERNAIVAQELSEQNRLSNFERNAKYSLYDMKDQQLFYEYTEGQITEENWNKLPESTRQYIRNPVVAAEAAYKYGNDLSHFYTMVDGDFTTETWEKLPDEIKQFVREPVSTAREYFENGRDQRYLYEVSSGRMTEEFWNGLPDEIKEYVRNPIELAKEFERQGDDLGYLQNLSDITDRTQLSRNVWHFLPDELKAHVVDPKLVISLDELQVGIDQQALENNEGLER